MQNRRALVIGSEGTSALPWCRTSVGGLRGPRARIQPGWRANYLTADITHPVDLLPAFDWRPDVVFLLPRSGPHALRAGRLSGRLHQRERVNNVLQLCKRPGPIRLLLQFSEVYGPGCDPMDDGVRFPSPETVMPSASGSGSSSWSTRCGPPASAL